MNQEFKAVLWSLYEEFSDEGIDWVTHEVASHLFEPDADDRRPTAGRSSAKGHKSAPGDDGDGDDGDTVAGSDAHVRGEDTDYEDGDGFSTGVQDDLDRLAVTAINSPADVVGVVRDLVLMAGEVRKFEEAQITKRTAIAAQRDVAVARIRAQKDILQDYLNRSFDERAENFARLFGVVDDALDRNNMEALAMGLESVVRLAASSPFKDLRTVEETSAALADPDHEWDF